MFIKLTNKDGVKLQTRDTLCAEDINVFPKLQSLEVTKNGTYSVGDGYAGIGEVKVDVGGGGGAEVNIAYGYTEPTDTSKLWVKTAEPAELQVKCNFVCVDDMLEGISYTGMPEKFSIVSMTVIGTNVYMFGRVQGSGPFDYVDTVAILNTETHTVESFSVTLPEGSTIDGRIATVGTKIYLFGGFAKDGYTIYDTINVFDTETNEMETLTTVMPEAMDSMTTAVIGTKIYLFGGIATEDTTDTIYVFDTETNTIEILDAKLPDICHTMSSAVVGTKIYLFGGYNFDNGPIYLDTICVFDAETNTIETLGSKLPNAAIDMPTTVSGTKIYLFGGQSHTSNSSGSSASTQVTYYDTINVFDTETNTLKTLNTKIPSGIRISTYCSASVGDKVYLSMIYPSESKTISVLTSPTELATNTMLVEASITKNLFCLLPNMEIGVNGVFLGNADGYGERVAAALYKDYAWTEIT
jgi:N-acetylneuraminic acid mutarotase